jgi:hypothetical protein
MPDPYLELERKLRPLRNPGLPGPALTLGNLR